MNEADSATWDHILDDHARVEANWTDWFAEVKGFESWGAERVHSELHGARSWQHDHEGATV